MATSLTLASGPFLSSTSTQMFNLSVVPGSTNGTADDVDKMQVYLSLNTGPNSSMVQIPIMDTSSNLYLCKLLGMQGETLATDASPVQYPVSVEGVAPGLYYACLDMELAGVLRSSTTISFNVSTPPGKIVDVTTKVTSATAGTVTFANPYFKGTTGFSDIKEFIIKAMPKSDTSALVRSVSYLDTNAAFAANNANGNVLKGTAATLSADAVLPSATLTLDLPSGGNALTTNTMYCVYVQAINDAGMGVASDMVEFYPTSNPVAPTNVSAMQKVSETGVDVFYTFTSAADAAVNPIWGAILTYTNGTGDAMVTTEMNFQWNGSSFVPASNIAAYKVMGASNVKANTEYQLKVSSMEVNKTYVASIKLVNFFGKSAASSNVTVTPSAPPSAPSSVSYNRLLRGGNYAGTSAGSNSIATATYDAELAAAETAFDLRNANNPSGYTVPTLATIKSVIAPVAVDITFKNPTKNWVANNADSNLDQSLSVKITSVDSNNGALAAAVRHFRTAINTKIGASTATSYEKNVSNDTVLSILQSITSSVSADSWTGTLTAAAAGAFPRAVTAASKYSAAQKSSALTNSSLAVSSGLSTCNELLEALDIYYAVVAWNKAVMKSVNSLNSNAGPTITPADNLDTSSYIWSLGKDLFGANKELLFFFPGSVLSYSIVATSAFTASGVTNTKVSEAATGSFTISAVASSVLDNVSAAGDINNIKVTIPLLPSYGLNLNASPITAMLTGANTYGPVTLPVSSDAIGYLKEMPNGSLSLSQLFGSPLIPGTYAFKVSALVADPLSLSLNGSPLATMASDNSPALEVTGQAPQPSVVDVSLPKALSANAGIINVKVGAISTSLFNNATFADYKFIVLDSAVTSVAAFNALSAGAKTTEFNSATTVSANANTTGLNYIAASSTPSDAGYLYSFQFTSLDAGKKYYIVCFTDVSSGADSDYKILDNNGAYYVPQMVPAVNTPTVLALADGSLQVTIAPANNGLGDTNGYGLASYKFDLYAYDGNMLVASYDAKAPLVASKTASASPFVYVIPAASGSAVVPRISHKYTVKATVTDDEGEMSAVSSASAPVMCAKSIAFNGANLVSGLQRVSPTVITGYINFMQTGATLSNVLLGWMAADPSDSAVHEQGIATPTVGNIINGQLPFTITLGGAAAAKEELRSLLIVAVDNMGGLIHEHVDL